MPEHYPQLFRSFETKSPMGHEIDHLQIMERFKNLDDMSKTVADNFNAPMMQQGGGYSISCSWTDIQEQ